MLLIIFLDVPRVPLAASVRSNFNQSVRILTSDAMRSTFSREYATLTGALTSSESGIEALLVSGFFGYALLTLWSSPELIIFFCLYCSVLYSLVALPARDYLTLPFIKQLNITFRPCRAIVEQVRYHNNYRAGHNVPKTMFKNFEHLGYPSLCYSYFHRHFVFVVLSLFFFKVVLHGSPWLKLAVLRHFGLIIEGNGIQTPFSCIPSVEIICESGRTEPKVCTPQPFSSLPLMRGHTVGREPGRTTAGKLVGEHFF